MTKKDQSIPEGQMERLSIQAAEDPSGTHLEEYQNYAQKPEVTLVTTEKGAIVPAVLLTRDLLEKLTHICVSYELMQARSERKAAEEANLISSIRQKIHMRIRALQDQNTVLYQIGGPGKYDKIWANDGEQKYYWQELRKLERQSLDEVMETSCFLEQHVNNCMRFIPEMCEAFERAQLVKRAKPQDTILPYPIDAKLEQKLRLELPVSSSNNGAPKGQAAEAKADKARDKILPANSDAVYDQMLTAWKDVKASHAERGRLEQGLREHGLELNRKQAILNEYVVRLEAVGVNCPTGADSAHKEDRLREYLDARRKVVNFEEDQEKARSNYGSWYTMNHPDEMETLKQYTKTADKLRAKLELIGVDVPKVEAECDNQDMFKMMILAHHDWKGWEAELAKHIGEKRPDQLRYGRSMRYIESWEESTHKCEAKIARYKLRYLEARKYLEDRAVVIPPEESFILPEEEVKTGIPSFASQLYGSPGPAPRLGEDLGSYLERKAKAADEWASDYSESDDGRVIVADRSSVDWTDDLY